MRKLTKRLSRFEGVSVGLDVHHRTIRVSILDVNGDEVRNESIPANAKAVDQLIDELAGDARLQVALEATGCFLWIFDQLVKRLGHDHVHVAAPSRVRVIANSMEKTDENDAWWLAYLLYERRLPEAFVAEGPLRSLRTATREYRATTSERADLMRRFRAHLAQLGRRMSSADWVSKVGRMRINALLADIADDEERKRALLRLLRRIDDLTVEQAHWHGRMNELAGAFPEIKLIQEVMPGVGPVISSITWAELGNPARYRSAKAYAKSTGLTPGNRESAGRRSRRAISREGSAHARWALTRAVIGCMRSTRGPGLIIRRWIEAKAKHKPKKYVVVAAARKLAEAVWRLFNLGESFDVARAFGG